MNITVYSRNRLYEIFSKWDVPWDLFDEDPQREKIFELNQEIVYLKGQITYLQEELSSVEDEMDKKIDRYEKQIADLEQQLGNALFRS